ncbi:MAG: DEAD/DEAH box helicase family protein, partial [Chloroflexi bacterium]|nr:DEAD/DEAH box helicase family protein [Chloroflexota bacterium]
MDITERNFEATIECALLAAGPDACPGDPRTFRETAAAYGTLVPGGYRKRTSQDYDPALCLDPEMVIAFVQATQPKEWARLKKHYGDQVRPRFLQRLAQEIAKRGTLDVLRKGVKDVGVRVRLVYFGPASGLNPELQKKYQANLFTVVRQLYYSAKDAGQQHRKSLDMALFLNGIPLFTVELKNPLTGQTYRNAIRQYQTTRSDPHEPLFAFRRCLAHLAVDPDEVWATTHLQGEATSFLPFNRGRGTGTGNPIPPVGQFATAYLWEQVWARDSVLDLVEHFVHEVEVEDDKGRKTGERRLIFPRYHQLDAVRRLVGDAREQGPGQRYLVQHSAGSGKSFTIAWLAHQLATLHDAGDRPVFDSVVVITDRRVLDRQLQQHVRQFEQVRGVVENIDKRSRQLQAALEDGKQIIVTTLQKFPVISDEIQALPGHRFAVIIDEAHSSQAGEQTKHLKAVLAAGSLEAAAAEEGIEGEDWEDRIVAEIKSRGHLPNVSTFAFTATPKPKTLELFGTPQPDGSFRAFSLYSMRQAIQEDFILDVLENYTTYRAYWSLLKKAEGDPRYDRRPATALLKSYVDLHEHAIEQKVATMVEHFHGLVAPQIKGQAKAMIVTRSRLHAVRFKLALDRYLKERGYSYQTLVAFSGTVKDPDDGQSYTEAGMNGLPESRTAETFKRAEVRFLVVAEKFQTGFDQPFLAAMYVDKTLIGVHAVQTLSRLNRIHPDKQTTQVLDFANEADAIQKAFAPYYEATLLTEASDPNLLYDLQQRLDGHHFYTQAEVDHLAEVWFTARKSVGEVQRAHPLIHGALQPAVDRFQDADKEDQEAFRGALQDYVRLYAFLAQVIGFVDVDLEKLYLFGRLLLRRLSGPRGQLPYQIQGDVELETFRLQQIYEGQIVLERGPGELDPQRAKGQHGPKVEDLMALSEIVRLLNEVHGAD